MSLTGGSTRQAVNRMLATIGRYQATNIGSCGHTYQSTCKHTYFTFCTCVQKIYTIPCRVCAPQSSSLGQSPSWLCVNCNIVYLFHFEQQKLNCPIDGVEDILPLLKTTGSYLREHGEELQALEEEEKALQRAILQAAAASGPDFSDILCQAIDLLTRVQQKLKQANPKWSANGVNFTDGRGKTKQVRQMYITRDVTIC